MYQACQSVDNKICGNDIVEEFGKNQNEYSCKQRYKGLQGYVDSHDMSPESVSVIMAAKKK